jgi:hypothetical protein
MWFDVDGSDFQIELWCKYFAKSWLGNWFGHFSKNWVFFSKSSGHTEDMPTDERSQSKVN